MMSSKMLDINRRRAREGEFRGGRGRGGGDRFEGRGGRGGRDGDRDG